LGDMLITSVNNKQKSSGCMKIEERSNYNYN